MAQTPSFGICCLTLITLGDAHPVDVWSGLSCRLLLPWGRQFLRSPFTPPPVAFNPIGRLMLLVR